MKHYDAVVIGAGNGGLTAATTEDEMNSMDAPNWGMLTCQNFIDEDLAPKGKSVVTLVALQYGEVWDEIRRQ